MMTIARRLVPPAMLDDRKSALGCCAYDPACPRCMDDLTRLDPGHRCAALCEMKAELIANPVGHRIIHAPDVHRCGLVLNDKRGNEVKEIHKVCPFKRCNQFFCPGCRRYLWGAGAIACACDTNPSGHGTYAEYARPSVRHLVKGLKHSRKHPRRRREPYC
jgi:hypothetical protein